MIIFFKQPKLNIFQIKTQIEAAGVRVWNHYIGYDNINITHIDLFLDVGTSAILIFYLTGVPLKLKFEKPGYLWFNKQENKSLIGTKSYLKPSGSNMHAWFQKNMPRINVTFVLILTIYFVQSENNGICHPENKWVTCHYNSWCVLIHQNDRWYP